MSPEMIKAISQKKHSAINQRLHLLDQAGPRTPFSHWWASIQTEETELLTSQYLSTWLVFSMLDELFGANYSVRYASSWSGNWKLFICFHVTTYFMKGVSSDGF